MQRSLSRAGWLLALPLLMVACGGGGGGEPAPVPQPAGELALESRSVLKLRSADAAATQWVGLAQRARALEAHTTPDRTLLISRPAPAAPLAVAPPAGWSLIDFALHPSGEISLVLATHEAVRLQRLDREGRVLADQPFTDPQAANDPFLSDTNWPITPRLVPGATRDTLRLAAQGEDLVLVLRSGRWAVVAYGLRLGAGQWNTRWRTLVEPGAAIGGIGLTSGSFDPFASLDKQWHVNVDTAPDGRIAVAVSLAYTELAAAHAQHFGETVDPDLYNGALVTRLAADGRRLGSTLVDPGVRAELHGLRWLGGHIVLLGRARPTVRADGYSWDGWAAWLAADSGTLQQQQLPDIDRGDVLFDAAALPGGRWLLAGATGYWQNPGGGSISDDAQPLLALLPAAGQPVQRLTLAAGARHNQARSIAGTGNDWWVGGMVNGPGTHTADADPALLVAGGFARRVTAPGP